MNYSELFSCDQKPVFLVSAESPGCGSSTLCSGIEDRIQELYFQETYSISIGDLMKKTLGVTNEQELNAKLSEVDDPSVYDPQIYSGLPTDKVVIVDGKLATTYGPIHIDADRPVISIDITSPGLVSARRILSREGKQIGDEQFSLGLLEKLDQVEYRRAHDLLMRATAGEQPVRKAPHEKIQLDTSRFAPEELIEEVFPSENEGPIDKVHEWEIKALKDAYLRLHELSYRGQRDMRTEDRIHFEHQMEAINYNIERLQTTVSDRGLVAIRSDLRTSLVDCWYGLMMKRIPRFKSVALEKGTALELDEESPAWSPEFYKIAEGWPTIKAYLEGKSVLDPFAGSGEMMNLLVARGILSSAVLSDILYESGNNGQRYEPALNTQAGLLLFDSLPSWYKPDLTALKGYVAGDSRKLPYKDNAFDYVFGDPPYGKNHDGPGIGTLFGSISELNRVATEGVILLVPDHWLDDICAAGLDAERLTKDLSRGQSNYPVCYIKINKY